MIKVAREGTCAFDDPSRPPSQVETKSAALWRELAIADRIVNDLPSPMSSAMIPPLASWRSVALAFVKTC